MKQLNCRLFLIIFVAISEVAFCGDKNMAQVTVKVLDDIGNVISGATVTVSTFARWVPGENFGRTEYVQREGVTDNKGVVVLQLAGSDKKYGYIVHQMDKFYWDSGVEYNFTHALAGKWQPWNPTVELQLKRIVNPVAMYVRRYGEGKPVMIPEIGKPVGFDLMKGDWIAPYGKGEVGDFIFKLDRQLGGMTSGKYQIFDATLTLNFSNEGDGIQSVYAPPFKGSQLRLPRLAPESGYLTNLVKMAYEHEDASSYEQREDQNYFFRVRSDIKDDKINNALYGKIHGEIEWQWNGQISFVYYLNPTTNDRSMEFDPKKNLFKDLPSVEEVNDP